MSADQLRSSSLEGNPADVKALLDAGVNVNSGTGLSDSALYFAVFSGCGAKQGETAGLINTVNVLIARRRGCQAQGRQQQHDPDERRADVRRRRSWPR